MGSMYQGSQSNLHKNLRFPSHPKFATTSVSIPSPRSSGLATQTPLRIIFSVGQVVGGILSMCANPVDKGGSSEYPPEVDGGTFSIFYTLGQVVSNQGV